MSIDTITLALAKSAANNTTINNSTAQVPEWAGGIKLNKDQLVSYMGKLYKAKKAINATTTSPDIDSVNYEVYTGGGTGSNAIKFPGFNPQKDYSFGECIVVNNCLYSSKASFTSGQTFDTADWNVISDMQRNIYDTNYNGIVDKAEHALVADKSLETELIQQWKPNTDYSIGQNIFYNYETYTVTSNFKSGTTFNGANLMLSGTGNHNNLRSLQGGKPATNEYFHIAQDKYNIIENLTMSGNKVAYNSIVLGDMLKSVYDANNDGIVDKATTLDGLAATVNELNFVHGVTSNIQAQLNALSSIGNFTGSVPTKADIITTFPSPKPKDMVIVVADESHGGTSTIYLYNGAWVYSGAFTATVRDFSTNPLDIATESTGLFLEPRIDPLIARVSQLPIIPNLSLLTTYTQTDADLADAVLNKHAHPNKALLDTYTQSNIDIGDAINKKHTHANKLIIDKFSEDASGKPLYNGNPIAGVGGGGITDLSAFNTTDLADSSNHRYVTDAEKTNLQNLTAIVAAQSTMTTTLTNINAVIPSDATSANKLVSTSTMTSKLAALKFKDLSDVTVPLVPKAFVTVNATGSGLNYRTTIDDLMNIQKVTDSDGINFAKVPFLKFPNLVGTQNATTGELTLDLKAYSTDLLDMPADYADNKVLVSNFNLQKYELKDIGDLTNSKANYTHTIQTVDWVLDPTLGVYTTTVTHNLNSKDLIVGFLDSTNTNIKTIDWTITDFNKIMLKAPNNNSVRVVVNCSQGAVGSGTGTGTGGGISAIYPSDFIDDTRVRTDKTYSSSKIMSVLGGYAQKTEVYTMNQANALFSSKLNEHVHSNIDVLTNLTSDVDNNLYFKGTKLLTGAMQPFTYQNHWTNQIIAASSLLVDVSTVFTSHNYNAILSTELTLVNNIPSIDATEDAKVINQVHLVAIDGAVTVLDVLIPPGSTQKYLLGISPNLKVMISGSFSGNYYLTAY